MHAATRDRARSRTCSTSREADSRGRPPNAMPVARPRIASPPRRWRRVGRAAHVAESTRHRSRTSRRTGDASVARPHRIAARSRTPIDRRAPTSGPPCPRSPCRRAVCPDAPATATRSPVLTTMPRRQRRAADRRCPARVALGGVRAARPRAPKLDPKKLTEARRHRVPPARLRDPHDHRDRAGRLHRDHRVLLHERQLGRADGDLADRREGRRARRRSSPSSQNKRDQHRRRARRRPSARSPCSRTFQAEFAKAIKSDLDGRKAALARMHAARERRGVDARAIRRSQQRIRERVAARRWRRSSEAGLIDRNAMLVRQVPARADLDARTCRSPSARPSTRRAPPISRRRRARSRRCSRTQRASAR